LYTCAIVVEQRHMTLAPQYHASVFRELRLKKDEERCSICCL